MWEFGTNKKDTLILIRPFHEEPTTSLIQRPTDWAKYSHVSRDSEFCSQAESDRQTDTHTHTHTHTQTDTQTNCSENITAPRFRGGVMNYKKVIMWLYQLF